MIAVKVSKPWMQLEREEKWVEWSRIDREQIRFWTSSRLGFPRLEFSTNYFFHQVLEKEAGSLRKAISEPVVQWQIFAKCNWKWSLVQ